MTSIRDGLVDLLTRIEAAIDFPDDVAEFIQTEDTLKSLQREVLEPLRRLIRNYVDAHVFRDGIAVAVVGRPNVGKSSYLNRLLNDERVIVSDVPGTTRDPINMVIDLDGEPFEVIDTAGIKRRTKIKDDVEFYAVLRARETLRKMQFLQKLRDQAEQLEAELDEEAL